MHSEAQFGEIPSHPDLFEALAPQVGQFLRELRDNTVLQTSGSAFMGFSSNDWS